MNDERKFSPGEPFIPSWMDGAGLPPDDYRVLGNLWRRRNRRSGQCNPSVETIAADCLINRKTVFSALKRLEVAGLIKRTGKPFAGSNRYDLFVPSTVPPDGTIDAPPIVPPDGTPIVPRGGTPIVPPGGTGRFTREGSQMKGVGTPHLFSLTDTDRAQIVSEFNLSDAGLTEAMRIYSENKGSFPRDLTPPLFRGWLRSRDDGKKLVKRYQRSASSTSTPIAEKPIQREPYNWRERLKDRGVLDKITLTMQWPAMSHGQRGDVLCAIAEADAEERGMTADQLENAASAGA